MTAASIAAVLATLGVAFVTWWQTGRRRYVDSYRTLYDAIEVRQQLRAGTPPTPPTLPEQPMQVLVPGPAAEDNPCHHQLDPEDEG